MRLMSRKAVVSLYQRKKRLEIGKKKKNGILPKGGILADDMGLVCAKILLRVPEPPIDVDEREKLFSQSP